LCQIGDVSSRASLQSSVDVGAAIVRGGLIDARRTTLGDLIAAVAWQSLGDLIAAVAWQSLGNLMSVPGPQ
jgi:hypothetical protein